ncbi:uncharacterized protein LOC132573285 [Heteronotia binoei]|uniref:uncharacterized protein LOC132573285 n=1 Tax=Heteronotia binoei TaxID=13085 RepID=UPI00292D50A9|nr:uncharacterized protein LOC132573285 [Heteronotia binoei]
MFLQTTLMPIEETVLILEQDALTAPELFEAMFRLLNSLKQRKADSFFGTDTDKALRKMPPSKARKVKQDFLKFFEKTIAYLEAKFDFSEKNHLCALTPFSLLKSVTYDHLRCAAEQLKMEKIINLDNLYSEYTDAKSLLDEQVACVDPKITVDKKWVAIFSEMGTRSHKCENLLLLVSKILSIPCSNAFVERVFSLMSAHWTETRNRCNVDLVKAELQVKVNFDMDCEQFYHYIKEKKDILKAAGKSEKYKFSKKKRKTENCVAPSRPQPFLQRGRRDGPHLPQDASPTLESMFFVQGEVEVQEAPLCGVGMTHTYGPTVWARSMQVPLY